MNGTDPQPDVKAILDRQLRQVHDALLWKLDGLSEYDVRRPLTPTGTNLLGLVKHVATVALGYFGDCFDRRADIPLPWAEEDAERNADMWATADETREQVIDLHRRAWAHAHDTIAALPLDAPGRVPWWGDRADVTLQQIIVHMIAETNRHAGHADILRELIDGSVGHRAGTDNLGFEDESEWRPFHDRLEQVAQTFRTTP